MEYKEFIKNKTLKTEPSGINVKKDGFNQHMFGYQKDVVSWGLKRGRCEFWQECGLGKTIEQLEWGRHVSENENTNVIIFAPLAVSSQTKQEGEKFGIAVNIIENQADIKPGINITNYEKMSKFDYRSFGGVVLDESSILKSYSGKTRDELTKTFRDTPYKLGCSATPAPNDFMEIGCHAEFLGLMTRAEMLSTFFVHDGGDTAKWRLKGHAEDKFWEWIASWAAVMQKPSDLGYENDFCLPDLKIDEHIIKSDNYVDGSGQLSLLPVVSQTLSERRGARRNSMAERVQKSAEIANATDEQVLIWCDLNDESEMLKNSIKGAVEVKGSDSENHKISAMTGFTNGSVRVLVSKPSIAGWGMNWQNCRNVIFVGVSDSYEAWYQAIRRCWRFGQKKEVNVHMVISDSEGTVIENIKRKHKNAQKMTRELIKHTKNILSESIRGIRRETETYQAAKKIIMPEWIREMAE